jgi:outer membrane protein insertion porin family
MKPPAHGHQVPAMEPTGRPQRARWLAIACGVGLAAFTVEARADSIGLAASYAEDPPRKIEGFEVRGKTKLKIRAFKYIANVDEGHYVRDRDRARMKKLLISSELFESADVHYEPTPTGGVTVVADLDDKHSWIIAPTVWFLAGQRSVGVGYAENNLFGLNQKLLLYGQVGDRENLFFGVFLDENVRGTPLTLRFDLYAYDRVVTEFVNPPDDPTSREIGRTSTGRYIAGAILAGWNLAWWAIADLRLRAGYVSYSNARAPDGTPLPDPAIDGRDVGLQARITLDRRIHDFGVSNGSYLQLQTHVSVPGLDEYRYQWALLRAYRAFRLFEEHQLEFRTFLAWGRHLPVHDEWLLGGATDLRGYAYDQFRGDTRAVGRVEYSVPIWKYKFFAFRALAFWDTGYLGYQFRNPDGTRDYLPTQANNAYWFRNDVGAGFRVYVKRIVLPLVGFDLAYGIEGKAPEVYFQLGLTDF